MAPGPYLSAIEYGKAVDRLRRGEDQVPGCPDGWTVPTKILTEANGPNLARPAQGASMPRQTSSLSKDPLNIRKRLRRREVPLQRDLKMLANSRKPLEDWDTEELARGRPRAVDGTFRGDTPKWITPLIMDEAKRRLKVGALETLSSKVLDAIDVIHKLMMCDDRDEDGRPIVDARTRLQAAQFIIEHTIGKARQPVDLHSQADGYRQFLAGALKIVDNDGKLVDAHPIIEGTFEEDGDE